MSRGRQGRDLSPPRRALDLAHRLSRDCVAVRERVRPRRRRCGCAAARVARAEVLGPECFTHRLPLPPRSFLFGSVDASPYRSSDRATDRADGANDDPHAAQRNEGHDTAHVARPTFWSTHHTAQQRCTSVVIRRGCPVLGERVGEDPDRTRTGGLGTTGGRPCQILHDEQQHDHEHPNAPHGQRRRQRPHPPVALHRTSWPQGGRRRRFTLIARATTTAPARPLEVPAGYDRSLVRAEGGPRPARRPPRRVDPGSTASRSAPSGFAS